LFEIDISKNREHTQNTILGQALAMDTPPNSPSPRCPPREEAAGQQQQLLRFSPKPSKPNSPTHKAPLSSKLHLVLFSNNNSFYYYYSHILYCFFFLNVFLNCF
jgi:hypothetical protein